jgi:hyaluronan synthase
MINFFQAIRFFIPLVIIGICVIPIVLQYVYKWKLASVGDYYIGVYTIFLGLYLTIQLTFSLLNNKKCSYLNKDGNFDPEHDSGLINVAVVGYRENPEYFSKCLISVYTAAINTNNVNKIFVIIDGQDSEDLYMVDIFKTVFSSDSVHVNINKLPSELKDEDVKHIVRQINSYKFICITQPHRGKRHGLYTGFKFSILENEYFPENKIRTFFCTDSDTLLDTDTLTHLYSCHRSTNIAASTGYLRIFNKYDTPISFLISIRYWFSCFLERSYQSFNKCVLCVSGPIGMYKLEYIKPILDTWVNQVYLGKECTYGDDRHLTNLILTQGKHIVFNPEAGCSTETPSTFYRFYKQQIRWAKSSYREFLWNIKSIHKQSLFMTVDLTYQFIYTFIVMIFLCYALFFGTLYQMSLYFLSLFGIGLIKGIYSAIYTKDIEKIFFSVYGGLFMTLLLPARLYAAVTMYDISWGTSARKNVTNNRGWDYYFMIFWNIVFFGGLIYNIVRNFLVGPELRDTIIFSVTVGLVLLKIAFLLIFIRYKNKHNVNLY